MPKKAVAIFFAAAFLGAILFVYFTFPRTKSEIPVSNNQRPFPSAPDPGPSTPGNVPAPDSVPHPTPPPKVPPGPNLRVKAWASGAETQQLQAAADAFGASTGRYVSLTVDSDAAQYRRDLAQAIASSTPPDLCLVAARDFSGLDPAKDLADVQSAADTAPRCIAAFTVDKRLKAVPDEFSVDVLFYNPLYFDQAGIGYPAEHWNWDILEADARALQSLKLTNAAGASIYAVELPADFDFWNILCTQAGHPALDQDVWHLADAETKDSQMRGLDLIQEFFHGLTVTAPPVHPGDVPGRYFAQQRAALLIGPSSLRATLPSFPYAITLVPEDQARASLAQVNGWAVPSRSSQPEAARILAQYLAQQAVHDGWSRVQKPVGTDTPEALCYTAMNEALVPRVEPRSARLAHFLDQQIDGLARTSQKTDVLFARIQNEVHSEMPSTEPAPQTGPAPKASADAQLRGL